MKRSGRREIFFKVILDFILKGYYLNKVILGLGFYCFVKKELVLLKEVRSGEKLVYLWRGVRVYEESFLVRVV